MLSLTSDRIAFAAIVLALLPLAWAAIRFVYNEKRKLDQAEFENFYRTLERVHNKDGSLILQRAAVFELRNFPKYRDFIVRLCRDRNDLFPVNSEKTRQEMLLTLQYFEKFSR